MPHGYPPFVQAHTRRSLACLGFYTPRLHRCLIWWPRLGACLCLIWWHDDLVALFRVSWCNFLYLETSSGPDLVAPCIWSHEGSQVPCSTGLWSPKQLCRAVMEAPLLVCTTSLQSCLRADATVGHAKFWWRCLSAWTFAGVLCSRESQTVCGGRFLRACRRRRRLRRDPRRNYTPQGPRGCGREHHGDGVGHDCTGDSRRNAQSCHVPLVGILVYPSL
jgi:hypothetical protein